MCPPKYSTGASSPSAGDVVQTVAEWALSFPLLKSKVAEGEREAAEKATAHPDAPWQAGGPGEEPGRQ